tara:strand:+ start:3617 stop:8161 length:4545 start_codon:yes stop_codon:yes gene_type:complete
MSISTYIKKLILSLILFFFYFNSVSQQISIINENNLVSIFNKRLKSNDITIKEKDEYQKTILIWNENLNNSEKKIFISILNTLNYKNDYNFISFLEYFNLIISEKLISKNKVEDLLYNYLNIITNKGYSDNYFKNTLNKIYKKIFIESPLYKLYGNKKTIIDIDQAPPFEALTYAGTSAGSIVFIFSELTLKYVHNKGEFFINTNRLKYYPDLNVILGEGGKVDLIFENNYIKTKEVILDNFSIDLKNGNIISNSSKLIFNDHKPVLGVFSYDPSKQNQEITEFIFQSNGSDLEIIINNNLKLESGILLNGEILSSSSKKSEYSSMTFLLENNKKIFIRSKSFSFLDNKILSNDSRFVFINDNDSIYHPSLELKYNSLNNTIELYNIKGKLSNTPFYSSFFDVEIISDYLFYTPGQRLMNFGIIVAPNQRALSVKSLQYYSENIMNELTDLNGINILKTTYNFAIRSKRLDFFIDDLSLFLKKPTKMIVGGVISLWRKGFINYNPSNGLITVLPKTRHFFMSHIKKSDYDEFNFNSISPNSNNLRYDIKENKMFFGGVSKITISKKNKIEVFPTDGKVELSRNRNLKLKGDITVGNFDFVGVDLLFDYESYKLDLLDIDTLKMISKKNLIDKYNYLYNIGGDLFINESNNKSSLKSSKNYPYFISDKSTKVFLNMPNEYGSTYDSSFYFTIDQFQIDSLDKSTLPKFEFSGTFYSNNIFMPLEAQLVTMPDNSFGFDLDIGENGISAYNNKIHVFEKLKVDSTGLYAEGNFTYNQLRVFSNKIRFFPDSLSGFTEKAFLYNGFYKSNEFYYPDMEFSNSEYSLYNFTEDYIYLRYDSSSTTSKNLNSTFTAFNNTMEVKGDVWMSESDLRSEGVLLYNNSTFLSDEFKFNSDSVISNLATINLNHYNYDLSFLKSDGMSLILNIKDQMVRIKAEYPDKKNYLLPYYKTFASSLNADWDIINEKLSLNNENRIDFSSSVYPYSSSFSKSSIKINSAEIDLKEKLLNLNGVDELQVSDAFVLPRDGKIEVGENFILSKLYDSEIVLDTINEYHRFINASVDIKSKDQFIGSGIYEYVNFNNDTFNIPFSEFKLVEILDENEQKIKTSFSSGIVDKESPILMEPGFNFFGKIELYANNAQLLFNGKIIPSEIKNFDENRAISYNSYFAPGDQLSINISEQDNFYSSAISKNEKALYFDFFNNSVEKKSLIFFNPNGLLSYDSFDKVYLIETNEKRDQKVYNGNSLLYSPSDKLLSFEGSVNLIDNDNNFKIYSSMTGRTFLDSMDIQTEGVYIIDVNIRRSLINRIAELFNESIENFGAGIAHDNEQDLLVRLSDIVGNDKVESYENTILNSYRSLLELDPIMSSFFVLPNTKLNWSSSSNSWYNTSVINVSNIGDIDINASMDGFFELEHKNDYNYILSFFLQPSPEFWLYISYDRNQLKIISSDPDLNSEFDEIIYSRGKYINTALSNEDDVLNFVNNFRLKYFNISEPYNLLSPTDTFLEDEIFKTISDDDDGF